LPNRRRKKTEVQAQPTGGFAALGLSSTTLAALEEAGYLEPTPIQGGLIPRALEGADLMGQARTGTGKTAAFGIPILERIEPHKPKGPPQALVLVPTRELAVQVRDECRKLALGRKTHIVALYGGKPIRQQVEHLRQGADVAVGTPGRILDHLDRRMAHIDRQPGDTLDEKIRALRDCIERLAPLYREPVDFHYRDHRTTEWIARRLATTKDAVQKQLQRARAQLADCLERKGVLAEVD